MIMSNHSFKAFTRAGTIDPGMPGGHHLPPAVAAIVMMRAPEGNGLPLFSRRFTPSIRSRAGVGSGREGQVRNHLLEQLDPFLFGTFVVWAPPASGTARTAATAET